MKRAKGKAIKKQPKRIPKRIPKRPSPPRRVPMTRVRQSPDHQAAIRLKNFTPEASSDVDGFFYSARR